MGGGGRGGRGEGPPSILYICVTEIEFLEYSGQSESTLNQNQLRDPPFSIRYRD